MPARLASFVAVLALSVHGPVVAQSAYVWEELGSGDGMTVSYNPLTVRHNSRRVTFLEKVSYSTPQPLGDGVSQGYYTVDITIDCAANTYQHANYTAYTAEGAVIPGAADSTPAGMNPIAPGGAPSAFKAKFCT